MSQNKRKRCEESVEGNIRCSSPDDAEPDEFWDVDEEELAEGLTKLAAEINRTTRAETRRMMFMMMIQQQNMFLSWSMFMRQREESRFIEDCSLLLMAGALALDDNELIDEPSKAKKRKR
jgi:hypothetical protein